MSQATILWTSPVSEPLPTIRRLLSVIPSGKLRTDGPNTRPLDRSGAQWREPRIGGCRCLSFRHSLREAASGPPKHSSSRPERSALQRPLYWRLPLPFFPSFPPGSCVRTAQTLVLSTGAERSGEPPVLAAAAAFLSVIPSGKLRPDRPNTRPLDRSGAQWRDPCICGCRCLSFCHSRWESAV